MFEGRHIIEEITGVGSNSLDAEDAVWMEVVGMDFVPGRSQPLDYPSSD
jgi:hypothetical protein